MADAVRNPLVSIDPRYFLTGDVVERPPAERPKHDTIEAIIDWLARPAQHIPQRNIFHCCSASSTSTHGGCWRRAFRCYGRPFSSAPCTRNTSAQLTCGGAPPARPCRL